MSDLLVGDPPKAGPWDGRVTEDASPHDRSQFDPFSYDRHPTYDRKAAADDQSSTSTVVDIVPIPAASAPRTLSTHRPKADTKRQSRYNLRPRPHRESGDILKRAARSEPSETRGAVRRQEGPRTLKEKKSSKAAAGKKTGVTRRQPKSKTREAKPSSRKRRV
ncbi:Hypothetical protein D9617_75g011860 [Elsinoe fawcettii]|nr:Hypothetical protein D9617_75g011860 [Elsinoe fawcettii]